VCVQGKGAHMVGANPGISGGGDHRESPTSRFPLTKNPGGIIQRGPPLGKKSPWLVGREAKLVWIGAPPPIKTGEWRGRGFFSLPGIEAFPVGQTHGITPSLCSPKGGNGN